MAMSIGELFVSLGFDVDDSKLKTFNDEIVSARDGLFKVAAAATAAVAAVGEFISGPINRASVLKQYGDQFGYSSVEMEKWARVIQMTNATVSMDAALGKIKDFASYIQKLPTGGAGSSLAYLIGGSFHQGEKPEEALAAISENMRNGTYVKLYGEDWRSYVIPQLKNMNLGAEVLDALMTTAQQRDTMTAGKLQTPEQTQHFDEINRKVQLLQTQFENMQKEFTAKYGDTILQFLQEVMKDLPIILSDIDRIAQALGGWKKTAEELLAVYTAIKAVSLFVTLGKVGSALMTAGEAAGGVIGGGLTAGGAAGVAAAGAGWLALGASIPLALDHFTGWGQKFADWAEPVSGKNVIDRSMDSVSNFMRGGDSNNGQPVEHLLSPVTINIYSSQDPKEIADHVEHLLDEHVKRTNKNVDSQLNKGANY